MLMLISSLSHPAMLFTDNFGTHLEYSSYSVSGGAADVDDLTAIELISFLKLSV